MTQFSLRLLGSFEVRPASGSTTVAPGKKIQALLAVLGVRSGEPQSRDRLASMLWSHTGEEQARHSLRQAIFSIRQLVAENLIKTSGDTISLNREVIAVDVTDFEQACAAATPHALERAIKFYRGNLLEDFRMSEPPFEKWLVGERERLQRTAVTAFERVVQLRIDTDNNEAAIDSASRLVMIDPTREASHRMLMRLYLETGRRGAAIRQYQACERVLATELRVSPDTETRTLYESIAAQDGASRVTPGGAQAVPAVLIVEDEPVTRAVLEGFLNKAGYDVTAVSDGAEALFQLSGRHFDLILSDIAMPTLDGLALADVVARKGLRAAVIFITGQPGDELEIKGLETGAADFIRKPIQKDVLLLRVQKALRGR
jgi:DNA-binding SARP family transcriptional activator